ncbi:MAG: hypothetical protein SynsKO_05910 [Synoicihabitans sp.]
MIIETDNTLLERLASLDDQSAWQEFFERYWPLVINYAMGVGLKRAQAEEVLQETMVVLMRVMPRFKYDRERGRFRGYLKTVVQRLCYRTMARNASGPAMVNLDVMPDSVSADPTPSAADALASRDEDGKLWEQSLFEAAVKAVFDDPRIDERTCHIFRAYVLENQSAQTVADRFKVDSNAVYQIKNRLMRRVRTEAKRLKRDLGL